MYDKINQYVHALNLTPLSSKKVEGWEVKEAHIGIGKPIRFDRGSSSSSSEPNVQLEEKNFKGLIELPVDWYSPCVRNLAKQGWRPKHWSKDESHRFEKFWNNEHYKLNSKEGVGLFGTVGPVDDVEYYLVVTNHLESDRVCSEKTQVFQNNCLEMSDDFEDLQLEMHPRNWRRKFNLQLTNEKKETWEQQKIPDLLS